MSDPGGIVHRLLVILMIGIMALVSVPRAGMSHDMASPAQVLMPLAHHHADCPDCPDMGDSGPAGHAPCPHGALCLLFALGTFEEHGAGRPHHPLGFPVPPGARLMSRAPSLELPPPRIGFAFA